MESFIRRCLNEADSRKLSSIAFPALGTGNLRFPKPKVAESMYRVVKGYGLKINPETSIRQVLFVIYQSDYDTIKVSSCFIQQKSVCLL